MHRVRSRRADRKPCGVRLPRSVVNPWGRGVDGYPHGVAIAIVDTAGSLGTRALRARCRLVAMMRRSAIRVAKELATGITGEVEPLHPTSPPMRRLLRPLWLFLAIVFLIEAWLWSHLGPAVARMAAQVGLPAFKARLSVRIAGLPPVATLLVFLVPVVLLLPFKLLGLWMLARGSWLSALAVLALAKVVSVAVTAFIFELTRPKLLELGWFRWVYGRILAALGWAHRQVDPTMERLRAWIPRGRLLRRLLLMRRRARVRRTTS
jgi:hypothetical protein